MAINEEILINITPRETRVAIVENGTLQEVSIERQTSRGIVGNIYKGKVNRVLPGMEAAFVDIGLDKAGFLHVSDIDTGATHGNDEENATRPVINELLHEGQTLLVQVVKDPMGTKGARLTTSISVPSRYLVYMPNSTNVGISVKIEDEAERERLKKPKTRLAAVLFGPPRKGWMNGNCSAIFLFCPSCGELCWNPSTPCRRAPLFTKTYPCR